MMSTERRLDAIPKQIHHEGMTVRWAPYNYALSDWFALDEDIYPRPSNDLEERVARPHRIDGAFGRLAGHRIHKPDMIKKPIR